MKKLWDKLVALIHKVPYDKLLHFVAGLIIAAFFAITLGMKACLVPVIFAGVIKEAFDSWTSDQMDWYDFLYTVIGGAVIQVFVLL